MNIALLAPFDESIPPSKYGGIEQILYSLVNGLVAKGHNVTLFAAGTPQVHCRVVSIFPEPLRAVEPYVSNMRLRDTAKFVGISKVLSLLQKEPFDIFHNHLGWRFLPFASFVPMPMISTLHNPVVIPLQEVNYTIGSDVAFVSLSNKQQKLNPTLHFVATVHNGIDPTLYPFSNAPDDYLFFLGRISPEKGVKEAIEIAKKTGKKLIIAAKVDVGDQSFYESLRSEIDGTQIVMIGEIDLPTKVRYLQKAAALLSPIQWDEPFGLVAIEALSCGTPVLGMARGAYPEIVEQGKQGFLATTVEELALDVAHIDQIDRAACRRRVEEQFTVEKMVEGYEKVYAECIEKK